jgi:DHA1 family multidrug resistance protein-like MFS transporter
MEHWKVNLYTIWVSQVLSLMSFGFGIPFLPFYIQELGVVKPDEIKIYVGILNAAPAVAMAVMAPIWGVLADRWGKKLMLLRAMLFASLIIGGMSIVTSANQLVFLRLMQGCFTGTITAASALIASGTPGNRLSFALGFLSSSAFIGLSFGPMIGGLVAEYAGYRVSFVIGAVLMAVDFLLVLILVKESRDSVTAEDQNANPATPLISVFTPMMVIILFILLFTRIGRTVFNPYLPLYIQEIRSKTEGAASATGLVNGIVGLVTAISGLTISRLGDRYNKAALLAILLSMGILLSLPLALVKGLWLFTLVYSALFFVIGGVEPVIMSMTAECTPPERRGAVFGIQGTVGSIGLALAPLFGSVVSVNFSLNAVFLLIPAFFLISLAAVFFMRHSESRCGLSFNEGKDMTGD